MQGTRESLASPGHNKLWIPRHKSVLEGLRALQQDELSSPAPGSNVTPPARQESFPLIAIGKLLAQTSEKNDFVEHFFARKGQRIRFDPSDVANVMPQLFCDGFFFSVQSLTNSAFLNYGTMATDSTFFKFLQLSPSIAGTLSKDMILFFNSHKGEEKRKLLPQIFSKQTMLAIFGAATFMNSVSNTLLADRDEYRRIDRSLHDALCTILKQQEKDELDEMNDEEKTTYRNRRSNQGDYSDDFRRILQPFQNMLEGGVSILFLSDGMRHNYFYQ